MNRARLARAYVLGALAVLGVLAPGSVRAQLAETLAAGWVVERGGAALRPHAIACSRSSAFVVSEHVAREAPGGVIVVDHVRVREWNGHAVRELPPPGDDFQGNLVAASPGGHLYIPTGRGGPTRVAHFDGTAWSVMSVLDPSGRPYALGSPSIRAFDEQHVYIVGAGVIAQLEGNHFVAYSAGTTRQLYGIGGSGPRDMWLAGDYGTLLHWDGRTFTPEVIGTSDTLYDVIVRASGDVWVTSGSGMFVRRGGVWSRGNPHPRLVRVDGEWTRVDAPPEFVRFESRAGLVSLDDRLVAVHRAAGWVTEVSGWPVFAGCATATQIVVVGRGREQSPARPGYPEIHEPGDLLHRPL